VPMHNSVERLFGRCHFCVEPASPYTFKVCCMHGYMACHQISQLHASCLPCFQVHKYRCAACT
jgi:hypothetical protein